MRLGIVGATGWLGNALGQRVLDSGLVRAPDLVLLNRSGARPEYHGRADVTWALNTADLVARADVVVLSVRPEDYSGLALHAPGRLVVSFLAGVPLRALAETGGRVVRAMPNSATELGRSYTPWLAASEVTEADRRLVRALLATIGTEDEVGCESHIDYLTGLSGSGAAYPAMMACTMLAHARAQGLTEAVARHAVETVICGGADLLRGRIESASELVETYRNYMAAPPDPEIVGNQWEAMWRERLEASPPILATGTEHQHLDAYWKRGSVAFDYGDVRVPTYVVGGLHEPYSNQVARMLERLEVPRKGLIGPWKHAYPESATPHGLDWGYEEVRWWSHWLNGDETTGIMDEPMLRAFMQYATRRESLPNPVPGRWIAEQQWPPGRLGQRWYLNADGLTAEEPIDGAPMAVPPGVVVGQATPEWYAAPADEQSYDDALSLTFDSMALEEDIEVLGYPTVRIRVSADKPVAQLAVRVTEVTAEGKSWLVNYGVLNLTHRDSHETPAPLEPGQAYDVEFPLYLMSHRFRQGNRIRVGLSEGLWPLSWPSPEPVQLTITPGASSISLPVRPVEREPVPMPIKDLLGTDGGTEAFIPVEPETTGRIVLVRDTPPYAYEIANIGTEFSGAQRLTSEIVAGDPSTCQWQDSGSMGFKRGDWNCEVRSSYTLTADADMFHLTESVEALKDGERIFERTESHDIPRRLL